MPATALMGARPIVNDALWRCLCPSFAPLKPTQPSFRVRQIPVALGNRFSNSPRRSVYSTSPTYKHNAVATPGSHFFSINERGGPGLSYRSKPEKSELVLLPTSELYAQLRNDAAGGRHDIALDIIRILIKDRRERPNLRIYSALLHSFVSPDRGTAGKVRKVLEEMAEVGVDLDSAACHAVIEALAVHPDYLLRNELLSYMKDRWFTLSDRGHNMVAAGLLRDRLFEQALQKIEDMSQQRIKIADWLLDKAIWILLDYGEIGEAWNLLLLRQQNGRNVISQALWGQFLEVSAKMCHVDSITHIWSTRVIRGYLKPPTGTCLHVLNIAARLGNVKLATDVFRVLAERDAVLTSSHYEMLLEAYLNANDLETAISVIIIMTEGGIKVDEESVYALFTFLRQDKERPMEAFTILQGFELERRKVPTAAINVCIQASVHLDRMDEAIDMYKALHTVSQVGPNTQTFNVLFQGCHKAGLKELAMFLASEMTKLKIVPDTLTYDRLLLTCCEANDLHDALLYYQEMRLSKCVPRRGTFMRLVGEGIAQGHPGTPKIMADMKECGMIPTRQLEMSLREKFPDGIDTASGPLDSGTQASHNAEVNL